MSAPNPENDQETTQKPSAFKGLIESMSSPGRESTPPLEKQVEALIEYAAERGLLAQEGAEGQPEVGLKQLVPQLRDALDAYVVEKKSKQEGEDVLSSRHLDLLMLYSRLTRVTGQVTGRSLVDTSHIWDHLRPLFWITGVVVFLALFNEAWNLWVSDALEPEDGLSLWMFNFQRYVLDSLGPFLWGGLGACVFLLKTLSDKGREKRFDRRDLQGWRTRILLGAVLGTVVVYVYDPESFMEGSLKIDANAIAFFTGVGIKVVYGAIEKTVDELAQRFNLQSMRKDKSKEVVVSEYLEQELALIDPEKDTDKRKWLLSLIDGIARPAQNT